MVSLPSLKVKMPSDSFGCRTVGFGLDGEAVGSCQMPSLSSSLTTETPVTQATGAALLSLHSHGTTGKNCVVHKSRGY